MSYRKSRKQVAEMMQTLRVLGDRRETRKLLSAEGGRCILNSLQSIEDCEVASYGVILDLDLTLQKVKITMRHLLLSVHIMQGITDQFGPPREDRFLELARRAGQI